MSPAFERLRPWLVLGRVANLPTVWSNCLAGWLLGGGGNVIGFLQLCLGATLLYLAGVLLNDAFDAPYDRQHRPERPIPSGKVGVAAVWQSGLTCLGLGLICLVPLGRGVALAGCALSACLLTYNAVHKVFELSPLLLAACRCLVVLAGSVVGYEGLEGLGIWSGLALGSYVAGLSFLARKESGRAPAPYWPCMFLAPPLALALMVNPGEGQVRAVVLGAVVVVWALRSLRLAYWTPQRNVKLAVGGLLAGIVLVDLLAVGPELPAYAPAFVVLFLLAVSLQQLAPAT
jgi:4-hydroxybenzoate polyprenyltransferase